MSFFIVEKILRRLNAEHLLNKFKAEYIDDDALSLLQERHLRQLLPLGIVLKFMAALKEETRNVDPLTITPTSSYVGTQPLFVSQFPATDNCLKQLEMKESSSAYSFNLDPITDKTLFNKEIAQNLKKPYETSQKINPSPVLPRLKSARKTYSPRKCMTTSVHQELHKKYLVHDADPSPSTERSILVKPLKIVDGPTLKEALNTSDDGKAILSFFENEGTLDKKNSLKLCEFIIRFEFDGDPNRKLRQAEFKILSQSVVQLFPSELLTSYYCASVTVNGKTMSARGRLVDKYNTRIKYFKSTKLIQSKIGKKLSFDVDSDVNDALSWLQRNLEPHHAVLEKWKLTASVRLHSSRREDPIHEYFNKYPALSSPKLGPLLIQADFKHLYPDAVESFFNCWYLMAEKIIGLAQSKAEKDYNWRNMVQQSDIDLYSQDLDLIKINALCVLPFLFPVPGNVNRNKKDHPSWKPSSLECLDGFIMMIPTSSHHEISIREKENFKRQKKLPLQPFPILIKDQNCRESFVRINSTNYVFNSFLEAFDLCFKSFFSLNAEFPIECVQPYMFLQKFVYKISTKFDKNYLSVNELQKALKL